MSDLGMRLVCGRGWSGQRVLGPWVQRLANVCRAADPRGRDRLVDSRFAPMELRDSWRCLAKVRKIHSRRTSQAKKISSFCNKLQMKENLKLSPDKPIGNQHVIPMKIELWHIFLLRDSGVSRQPTYIARLLRKRRGTQKPSGPDAGKIGTPM